MNLEENHVMKIIQIKVAMIASIAFLWIVIFYNYGNDLFMQSIP